MQRKPMHVKKRLNFGQSILDLKAVDQADERRGNSFIIDCNVAKIPCTEKSEFVREWVETHKQTAACSSGDTCQLSPVLGSSKRAKRREIETSPVLGNWRKRIKRKASGKDNSVRDTNPFRSDFKINESEHVSYLNENDEMKGKKILKNKDVDKSSHDIPYTHDCSKNFNTNLTSPILDRNTYSYKKRRRKLLSKLKKRNLLEGINVIESSDSNINSLTLSDIVSVEGNDNTMLGDKSSQTNVNRNFMQVLTNESQKLQDMSTSLSPMYKVKLSINDSPEESKELKIETESSDEKDCCKDAENANSDSDKTVSDLIEDNDTQDVIITSKNIHSLRNILDTSTFKSTPKCSEISKESSDMTFYSKTEAIPCALSSTRTSEKISQSVSLNNEVTQQKSTQSDVVISTEMSPTQSNADPTMFISLLDSGKKRRKPRKGSLVEKLHSLVNKQMSLVRMWRHHVKQMEYENSYVQSVTLYVRTCSVRFSRHFLETVVVDDPFNLLENNVEAESNSITSVQMKKINTDNKSKKCSRKYITVMIIPDIVGKIELKSESLIKIYPPWETIDKKKSILNVTYISVVHKNTNNISEINLKGPTRKEVILQEFECPCMKENEILPFCTAKSNSDKPNVMEEIFKY